MADVEPSKRTCFYGSFRTVAEEISEVLSTSRYVAANGNWSKWGVFCIDVAYDPLLVSYRDLVPILNAFARQYRKGDIAPRSRQVRSHTVEESVRSIGQALAALGTRDPRLTIQGELYIRLRFQYCCYINQYPPPSQVNLIPLQVFPNISIIDSASGGPILQVECGMIITLYFFLL